MKIQRWGGSVIVKGVVKQDDGQYILLADHEAEIRKRDVLLREWHSKFHSLCHHSRCDNLCKRTDALLQKGGTV
jgi:hypothetical protein